MRKWSNRSLRNLKGIHPDLRRVMDRALQESPLDFVVIEGLRTPERQKELVASGASRTMNSRHITGHAVDLLPIGPNGPRFDWPLYDQLGPAVKAAAEAEGVALDWGGDWKSFRDGPHFQLDWEAYPVTDWRAGDKPRDRTVIETRTGAGAATAGVGGMGQAVLEAAQGVEAVAQVSDVLRWVFVGLIVLGTALALYARWDDMRRGVNP